MTKPTVPSTAQIKRDLDRAKGGDLDSARQIEKAEDVAPEKTDAVEQEASDGPPGRGLAR